MRLGKSCFCVMCVLVAKTLSYTYNKTNHPMANHSFLLKLMGSVAEDALGNNAYLPKHQRICTTKCDKYLAEMYINFTV